MLPHESLSRRSFLSWVGAAPLAFATPAGKAVPNGLELYSVRDELSKDLMGTVRAVAKMGYQAVEFYAPYSTWTPAYAREVRKLLDDLGVRCNSTHNDAKSFTSEEVPHAIELNQIIGSRYVVMASAGRVTGLDGWKKVADNLTEASERLRAAGQRGGYHNHQAEFTPVEGKRPMEIIAANTPNDFMLQLDVGTCVQVGSDPVAWIKANPGRIRSLHIKDWAPDADKGYRVLVGEGVVPWVHVCEAAESTGGVEYYLIEQEGSRFSELETAEKCLAAYKTLRS